MKITKSVVKSFCCILCMLVASICFFAGNFTHKAQQSAKASTTNTISPTTKYNYLKNPNMLAVFNNKLFTYDSNLNCLFATDANSTSVGSGQNMGSPIYAKQYELPFSITYLKATNNGLYGLSAQNSCIYQFKMQNNNLTYTKLTYDISNITDFAIFNDETSNIQILLLQNNSDYISIINANAYTNESITEISLNISNSLTLSENTKKTICNHIFVLNQIIYLKSADNKNIYSLSEETYGYTTKNVYNAKNNETLGATTRTNNAILTILITPTTKSLLQIQNGTTSTIKSNISHNINAVSNYNGCYFLADSAEQKVYLHQKNSCITYLCNIINIQAKQLTNQLYVTTKQDNTPLYKSPYNTNAEIIINANTPLTVIAQNDYNDYYYCIYTINQANHYLYVKTQDVTVLTTSPANTTANVIGYNAKLYSKPSTIIDSTDTTNELANCVVTSIPQNSTITIKKIQQSNYTVTNANGEQFYLVTTQNGTTGYININQLTLNQASYKQKIKCNARTKCKTTIYSTNPSLSNQQQQELELIQLNGNTRIYIAETIQAKKDYLKVIYQTQDGTTYTGYIKTTDIKSDKLTSLQIVGIVLVVINIGIIITILIIRKKIINAKITTVIEK